MKKQVFLIVIFGLALMVTFGANYALSVEPVKIACHAAFTGKYSAYGMATLNAVRYVVEKKNAEGGIKSLEVPRLNS